MERGVGAKKKEVLAYILAVREYYGQQAVAAAAVQMELKMSKEDADKILKSLAKQDLVIEGPDKDIPSFSISRSGIEQLTRK